MSEDLENKYLIQFKSNISGFHRDAEHIVIQNIETKKFDNTVNVFVEDSQTHEIVYNFELRCEIPGTFFRGHTFLSNFIVLGVEDYVYLYNIKTKESIMHKLIGYFDNFFPNPDFLIIGCDTHLIKLNTLGDIEWISDKLAIEKISIKDVNENTLWGSGNWGLPRGWEFFNLSLTTGKLIKENNKSEGSGGLMRFLKKIFSQAAF
ncbi:MAG: hypothetical protein JEZ09_09350 [Salinivirgaceae bacterium]|nr:hypothetical protein [Salinivirgaceae bacterium]